MRGDSTVGPWPSVWPGSSCRHACAPWQGPNSIPYPEELLVSGYCTAFCGQKVESVRSQRKHCRSKRNIIKWMHNSTMTIGQSNQKNPNGNHKKNEITGMPKKNSAETIDYFRCWLTCLLGSPLTKLAPCSISATLMRDGIPSWRHCWICSGIQLSYNTCVPGPWFLMVIWAPGWVDCWGSKV